MASWFIWVSTGLITNRLRKSERPTTTWLGGIDCSPRALRVSDRTMTMRVKLVIIISRAGATDSSVSAMMMVTLSVGFDSELPRLMGTWPGAAAGVAVGTVGTAGTTGAVGTAGAGTTGAAAAGFMPTNRRAAAMPNAAKTMNFLNTRLPIRAGELTANRALPKLLEHGLPWLNGACAPTGGRPVALRFKTLTVCIGKGFSVGLGQQSDLGVGDANDEFSAAGPHDGDRRVLPERLAGQHLDRGVGAAPAHPADVAVPNDLGRHPHDRQHHAHRDDEPAQQPDERLVHGLTELLRSTTAMPW